MHTHTLHTHYTTCTVHYTHTLHCTHKTHYTTYTHYTHTHYTTHNTHSDTHNYTTHTHTHTHTYYNTHTTHNKLKIIHQDSMWPKGGGLHSAINLGITRPKWDQGKYFLFFSFFWLPRKNHVHTTLKYCMKTNVMYANKSIILMDASFIMVCHYVWKNHSGRVGGTVACTWELQHRIENTFSYIPLIYHSARAWHVHLHYVFQKEIIFHLIHNAQLTENTPPSSYVH